MTSSIHSPMFRSVRDNETALVWKITTIFIHFWIKFRLNISAGQKFAMMELRTAIGEIIRNFKLIPITKTEEMVIISDLILRSRDPIRVQFVPRCTWKQNWFWHWDKRKHFIWTISFWNKAKKINEYVNFNCETQLLCVFYWTFISWIIHTI